MTVMGRPGLTSKQKEELWSMWRKGWSISEIGRALERQPGSIFGVLAAQGGISPKPQTRASHALRVDERESISRFIAMGKSMRWIASELHRSPSTISREIARNGGREKYRALRAEERARSNAPRPKRCLLAVNTRLRDIIANKLQIHWSPEQIAGWLRRTFPTNTTMHVSHETIYKSLFIQARGVLKKELVQHLRSHRVMRRARTSTNRGQLRGRIVDAVSIRERPAEVEDRAVPGHWEGDLITGTRNTHIATLVERTSRYTILVKLPGKDSATVIKALSRAIRTMPAELRLSLTWDRGPEMALHNRLKVATGVQIYFCDPQSPWQRGTNENTNRLLRQYLPKGTDLSVHTQATLNQIARQLNTRPRKTLHYKTPAAVLWDSVALTD